MKRCPECRRDYYDDTLLYCLDDGNALLEGPASGDERPTVRLSDAKESATAMLSTPTRSSGLDLLGKQSDFRWAPDGRSLYYLRETEGGVTNIWSMPLDDKAPKQVALARGTTTNDVVLIRDFH